MAKPHLVFKTQYGDRQQTKMVVMLVKAAAAKRLGHHQGIIFGANNDTTVVCHANKHPATIFRIITNNANLSL